VCNREKAVESKVFVRRKSQIKASVGVTSSKKLSKFIIPVICLGRLCHNVLVWMWDPPSLTRHISLFNCDLWEDQIRNGHATRRIFVLMLRPRYMHEWFFFYFFFGVSKGLYLWARNDDFVWFYCSLMFCIVIWKVFRNCHLTYKFKVFSLLLSNINHY